MDLTIQVEEGEEFYGFMSKFSIVMHKVPMTKLMIQHRNYILMRHALKNIIIQDDLFLIDKAKEVCVNLLRIF